MADPSTFTSLKSIRQPALAQPLGLPLLPRRGESEFRWIGHPNIRAPTLTDDPELSLNLRLLHSYALTYLFLHEIGHVVEGHIEFCREAKSRALQMQRYEREEFLRNELQPLEFLADQHALYAGALHILRYVWATPSIKRKRKSGVKHLTLYGIAAGIVSLIFEHYWGHSYSHPPASHRALYIRAAVHIDIPEFELSEDEIQKALNDGIEQAALGWDALGWPRSQDVPRNIEGFLAPLRDVSSRCVSPQIPPGLQPQTKDRACSASPVRPRSGRRAKE